MSQRSVGVDVVRAICVGGVVATHFSTFFLPSGGGLGFFRNALSLGSFGVTGFFLLSAYLLTSILLKEVGTKQTHIWRRYWIRRSLRIWPLYFLAIVVVALVALFTGVGGGGLPWLATFTFNWVSWSVTNPYLSHFWSMGAEEQLYILVPILAFVAFRWRWVILVAFIVIAPMTRLVVAGLLPYPAVWNFTTSHLDVFAIGMLLASLDYARGERWALLRARIAGSRWIALCAGLIAATLAAMAAVDPAWIFGSGAASWTYLLVAIVWAWLMIKVTERPLTASTPVVRGAVWMGQRSYGIYVYHWPVVVLGGWLATVVAVPAPVIGLVLIAGVLVVSELSFRWFETPFLRLKSRFSRNPAPIA